MSPGSILDIHFSVYFSSLHSIYVDPTCIFMGIRKSVEVGTSVDPQSQNGMPPINTKCTLMSLRIDTRNHTFMNKIHNEISLSNNRTLLENVCT